ncbi:hypothetical protein D3C71_1400640 [compost metagenome]
MDWKKRAVLATSGWQLSSEVGISMGDTAMPCFAREKICRTCWSLVASSDRSAVVSLSGRGITESISAGGNGVGRLGFPAAWRVQKPTGGTGMLYLRQSLDRPTSDRPS